MPLARALEQNVFADLTLRVMDMNCGTFSYPIWRRKKLDNSENLRINFISMKFIESFSG